MHNCSWHRGSHGPEDHGNLHHDPSEHFGQHHGFAHHHGSERHDDWYLPHRGGFEENRNAGDTDHRPHAHAGHGLSDQADSQGPGHDIAAPQHTADELGWNDAAWAEAGGFGAILLGHLPDSAFLSGGTAPIVIIAIDHLDVDFNTLIQNNELTQIQNTQVLFDVTNGGSVDIDGDVNAASSQQGLIDQTGGLTELPHLV